MHMEFHSKLLRPLQEDKARGWNGPLPFYMTYPDLCTPQREAALLQDLIFPSAAAVAAFIHFIAQQHLDHALRRRLLFLIFQHFPDGTGQGLQTASVRILVIDHAALIVRFVQNLRYPLPAGTE